LSRTKPVELGQEQAEFRKGLADHVCDGQSSHDQTYLEHLNAPIDLLTKTSDKIPGFYSKKLFDGIVIFLLPFLPADC
jgi:hypothetical protein